MSHRVLRYVTLMVIGFVIWTMLVRSAGVRLPYVSVIESLKYGDTVSHFLMFGLMSFLLVLSSRYHRLRVSKRVYLYSASFIVAILAITEEVSQLFLTTRTFELSDLSANLLGIFAFSLLASKLEQYEKRKAKRAFE